MKIFNLRIMRESEYQELRRAHTKFNKVILCYRWFSGWKDLDIIWNYIFDDVNFGGIERARIDYAKARKTDEYGEPDNF